MSHDDPFAVLGISSDATADELRARYRELVRRHPPDHDPAAFERIRDAYAAATDPHRRAKDRLFGPPPAQDLAEIAAAIHRRRPPISVDVWCRELAELRKRQPNRNKT